MERGVSPSGLLLAWNEGLVLGAYVGPKRPLAWQVHVCVASFVFETPTPRAHDPSPKCSMLFHDSVQTPGYPHGDG